MLFTIWNFLQGDLNYTGGIQISSQGVYNSTGGIQIFFQRVYKSTVGFIYHSKGFIISLEGYRYLSKRFISPLEGFRFLFRGFVIPLERLRYLSRGFIIPIPLEGSSGSESLRGNYKTNEYISESLQWIVNHHAQSFKLKKVTFWIPPVKMKSLRWSPVESKSYYELLWV